MTVKNITENTLINVVGRLLDPQQKINMPLEYYVKHKVFVDAYVDAKEVEIGGMEEYEAHIGGATGKTPSAKKTETKVEAKAETKTEAKVEEAKVETKEEAKEVKAEETKTEAKTKKATVKAATKNPSKK